MYRLPGEALDERCVDFSVSHLLSTPFIVQDVAASVSTRQVTHLNYGVIFSPVRRVKLVSDFWSHTFDLILPDTTPGNLHLQLPYCSNATSNVMQEKKRGFVNITEPFW